MASMAVGEIATFTVLPAYGYGAEGSPDGQVPPNATLTYHVELVEAHPRPKSLYEMTDEVSGRLGWTSGVASANIAPASVPR